MAARHLQLASVQLFLAVGALVCEIGFDIGFIGRERTQLQDHYAPSAREQGLPWRHAELAGEPVGDLTLGSVVSSEGFSLERLIVGERVSSLAGGVLRRGDLLGVCLLGSWRAC